MLGGDESNMPMSLGHLDDVILPNTPSGTGEYRNNSIYWDPVCIGTHFVLEKIII